MKPTDDPGAPLGSPPTTPTPTPNRSLSTPPPEGVTGRAADTPPEAGRASDGSVFHFDGDAYPTRRDEHGVWLELGALCAVFRRHVGNQARALKKKPWAKLLAVAGDRPGRGKKTKLFLHADSVPGWLFQLDTGGMPADLLAKLNRYKAESARALRDYWYEGGAINPRVTRPQASRFLETLELVLADDPVRHRTLWVKKIAGALAQLRGRELGDELYPFPLYLLRDIGTVYEILLGKQTYAEVRRRTGRGASRTKRYHALRSPAYEALDRELGKVEMLALQCRTMREFWDRLRHDYEGIPLQLGFEFGLERGVDAPQRP
ncbi:MAG TPA: phage antirepressor N-terminal domain-containing protein [Polyangiaceae bacterium]|nr:phage antirepressor N-terminal domain-containing protein [Polyangiaceae bacterium]